jgi:hypothetical protein
VTQAETAFVSDTGTDGDAEDAVNLLFFFLFFLSFFFFFLLSPEKITPVSNHKAAGRVNLVTSEIWHSSS